MFTTPGELQRLGDGAVRVAASLGIGVHLDTIERVCSSAARRTMGVASAIGPSLRAATGGDTAA